MSVRKSLRVLIADNEATFRNALGKLLTKAGHKVDTTTGTPSTVWSSVSQGNVDVVFLEWPLASAKDFALLRKMAATPAAARTAKIVTVSPEHAAEVKAGGDKLSCPALAKDYTPADLKEALKQALSASRKGCAHVPQPGEEAAKLFSRGLELLKAKEFDAAILDFSKAVKARRMFPEACKGLGMAFMGQGARDRALHFLNKALEQYAALGRTESAGKLEEYIRAHFGPGSAAKPGPGGAAAPGREVAAAPSLAVTLAEQPLDENDTLTNLREVLGDVEGEDAESLNVEVGGEEWYCRSSEEVKEEKETILDKAESSDKGKERRMHRRTPLVENFVRMHKRKELHPAVDICIDGVGFKDQGREFLPGDVVFLDLLSIGEEVLMKKVEVQVRHVTKGLVGCRFENLSSRNRKALERLLGW